MILDEERVHTGKILPHVMSSKEKNLENGFLFSVHSTH